MNIYDQFRDAAMYLAIFVGGFPLILLLAFVARHGTLPNFFPL